MAEDEEEIVVAAAVECDEATLTAVGIAVIDNGGGPFVMACDTAGAAAGVAVVEVD